MVERHLLGILLLAAHLALLECKFPLVSRKAFNMSQFLNTKESIWTYETNGPSDLECEVEIIHTITPKQIFFMKAYYENGKKITMKLLGKFDPHRLKHLDVYSLGGEMRFSEDIIYMSSTSSCAVIRVAKSGEQQPNAVHIITWTVLWYKLRQDIPGPIVPWKCMEFPRNTDCKNNTLLSKDAHGWLETSSTRFLFAAKKLIYYFSRNLNMSTTYGLLFLLKLNKLETKAW
nr:uncharacterized protein LOC126535281 isoform X3 [Dermacentor andersoni]